MDIKRPEHWEIAKLGELAVLTLGGDWGQDPGFESTEYSLTYCIRGAEFRNWEIDRGSTASLRMVKTSNLLNRKLQEGDILVEISGGGPEQPVGRTVLIDRTVFRHEPSIPRICTNFLRLFRPTHEIAPSYLNLYLGFFYRSGAIREYQAGSNNLRNLKFNDYLDIEIPVPPLAEQHRIVAKIEELFSELDQGVASLKTAREQLKVYRQSLLKNAFEGKLTTEWRAAHRDQLETAEALQQRIARERAERYRQQLSDWEAQGKPGPKPKVPKAVPPLSAEEIADLPKLPEGWLYVRAEEVSDFITKGTTPSKELLFSGAGDVPFIKVYNLTSTGALDFTIDPTFVSRETHTGFLARSKVFPGDVLMNIVGPPLGKVSIVPDDYPEWNINQAIAIFRTKAISAKLLAAYLSHERTVHSMMRKSKATAGQFNLTLEICRETIIPICSYEEQRQMELLIDEKLSEADQLDQTLATALQQADALRQSILKKAFSGQLVLQDDNDESAAVLLERIRAVRQGFAGKGRKMVSKLLTNC